MPCATVVPCADMPWIAAFILAKLGCGSGLAMTVFPSDFMVVRNEAGFRQKGCEGC